MPGTKACSSCLKTLLSENDCHSGILLHIVPALYSFNALKNDLFPCRSSGVCLQCINLLSYYYASLVFKILLENIRVEN